LIERVRQAGVPVILVLLSGRPLVLETALERSDAIVAAWLPGTEGQGVADVLFGMHPPRGKLPRPWPRNNNQLASTDTGNDIPLFPRGYGLTYPIHAKAGLSVDPATEAPQHR
jgi:beta-glucosidase